MMKSDKVGAVLVVGGGIAGIQASLDLAESGYYVYLVEKTPSIGGVMAQLDKTFPTNDCSMCILSPKMVEAGRHLNIKNLTYSEIESIKGEPGRFEVQIRKKARSIDETKCTGCGECTQNCLVRNIVYLNIPEKAEPVIEEEEKGIVGEILEKYQASKSPLIPVLQNINGRFNYLPPTILDYVAYKLQVPLAHVLRVATFYSLFSLKPRGKHMINVCLGTACHVRGGARVLEKLEDELGVNSGETTEDKKFTLETVRCIGCCALSPVIKVDRRVHSRVRPHTVMDILMKY
jgi:NADH:ubiquinone oxidoreductase subunit E/NAD-dependent dihydropyrimidine dehydrogenase PreA subunit